MPATAGPRPPLELAFDGARIDGGWFTDVTDWARGAPGWFDTAVRYWSAYGILVFAVLLAVGWLLARRAPARPMARVLCAPLVVVVVYAANDVLKSLVREVRPCRQLPGTFHLEACAGPTDWAFPSNHTVVAFSAATALYLVDRRLGAVSYLVAVAMGASRVYVGAHYPHDVAAAVVVGIVLGAPLTLLGGRLGTPAVDRLRASGGPLRPLVAAPPVRARARRPGGPTADRRADESADSTDEAAGRR